MFLRCNRNDKFLSHGVRGDVSLKLFSKYNIFLCGGIGRHAIEESQAPTSPLAPASEFWKKGLSGKYILVFTCPYG